MTLCGGGDGGGGGDLLTLSPRGASTLYYYIPL